MVVKEKGSYGSPFKALKFLFRKPITEKIPKIIKRYGTFIIK